MSEVGLLDRLRAKVGEKPAGALQSVEVIFSAMFLSRERAVLSRADAVQAMSAHTQKAFDQLWTQKALAHRKADGDGAPSISTRGRTPNPAAMVRRSPPSRDASAGQYRNTPKVRKQAAALNAYSSTRSSRGACTIVSHCCWPLVHPIHCVGRSRRCVQQAAADGGWTIESLGPGWRTPMRHRRPEATRMRRRSRRRTAARRVAASDPRLAKALNWLQSHQDRNRRLGAMSMNKRYPDGSMESRFMQDAATAFASLALIEAGR